MEKKENKKPTVKKEEKVKKEVKTVDEKEYDLFDILTDENNSDPINLFDENGKEVSFEQVAIVPLNNEIYAVLKPITDMPEIKDDEAIVFKLDKDAEGEIILVIEEDDKVGEKVFEEYYKLLDEQE